MSHFVIKVPYELNAIVSCSSNLSKLNEGFYFGTAHYLHTINTITFFQIERVIPIAGKSELTGFGYLFYSKTRRNLTDGHLWFSVFARPARSTFTRCQRALCCLSLLFSSMMANIFFYGIDVTSGSGIDSFMSYT